jgi:alkylation response protein AidB-like acyl-CoA dehydrogenase
MAVGVARAAYEHALRYAKARNLGPADRQKYRPWARMLVMKAGPRNGAPDGAADRLAECKQKFPRGAVAAQSGQGTLPRWPAGCDQAMQIFGGSGYMKDYPLEKLLRDAMVLPIISGANEV